MNKIKYYLSLVIFAVLMVVLPVSVQAKPLDEILNYEITADVNDDATVTLLYNISWKVLDSKSEGPLNWVKIGVPNSHVLEYTPLTSNISKMSTDNSGGNYIRVYFDRDYYKDEVVDFSFRIIQDNMYLYNPENGYADYTFTPGWFDDITVDNFTLRWNADKVDRFTPECINDNGYHTWNKSLNPGEKFTIKETYPGDAYPFIVFEQEEDNSYEFSEHGPVANFFFVILCIIVLFFMVVVCALPVLIPALIGFTIYKAATGFTSGSDKKITRTVVEYYPACPNCGGSRQEGSDICQFCGSNMVKSKETVTEDEIKKLKDDDKGILNFKENGTYQYSSNPNKYVHVNVITVPHVVKTTTRSSGSHHSSCAHSSCACACACACAGGGRAGCTTKDFYNTDLKMKHIKKVLGK